jgi:hypothetical protein
VDCFEKFDPLEGAIPSYPFFDLFDIAWKAREFLEGMTYKDIQWIEKDVDLAIEAMRVRYAKARNRDSEPLETEPDEFEDELSEIEALRMALELSFLHFESGEPSDNPVRCAAVLTLMYVSSCIEALECPDEDLGTCDDGPIAARLISAANHAINAASALGLAESHAHASRIEDELDFELKEQLADFSTERARRAAQKKHQKNRDAKALVFEWCDKNMSRFNSMDDAAMDIAESFIPQKFRAVRDWMTEWKKLRSASKP